MLGSVDLIVQLNLMQETVAPMTTIWKALGTIPTKGCVKSSALKLMQVTIQVDEMSDSTKDFQKIEQSHGNGL